MIESMEAKQNRPFSVTEVMAALEDVGLTANISAYEMRIIVTFRLPVATKAAELFRVCVQHMTHGLFIADVKNFSRVAALDPVMLSIPKVCILMYVYCQPICDQPASGQALVTSSGYFSEQVNVNTIARATIIKLSEQPKLLDKFAKFPVDMMKHYQDWPTDLWTVDILTARSKMLIRCGKCMIEVGEALAMAGFSEMARETVIAEAMDDSLPRIEAAFRRDQETAGAFRSTQMPPTKYQSVYKTFGLV